MIGELTPSARLRLWRDDPLRFFADVLPLDEQPIGDQRSMLSVAAANDLVIGKTHRVWGKSRESAYAALHFCVTRPNSRTNILATAERSAGVWNEIRHLWAVSKLPALLPSWRLLDDRLLTDPLTPKWRLSSITIDALEGIIESTGADNLLVVNEPKDFPSLTLSPSKGFRFFGIGTPGSPRGFYYDAFTTARLDFTTYSCSGRQSSDPYVRQRTEEAARLHGEDNPFFRQQWLAEFTEADS